MLKPRAASMVVAGLALVLAGCEPTNQGYQPRQPIVYSHAVHAGDLQIPCLYCHYAAERSKHAGIPPAALCMNCHAQTKKDHPEILKVKAAIEEGRVIPWVRVHRLPDHAFFDHSIHVARGVACQTCHGPIESTGLVRQETPLTMGWCLACHREKGAADPTLPVAMATTATRANRLTDCSVCHH